ncbi:TetR/AcrR family transcriptional regulator [Actinomyces viscosus]|uniref:HTH-type transcriptional repressor AcnR n=1 Tax=Actinomyces viscosus TaxID=1656 RepID=A0A3S4Z1G5_ACTVI|nr:TetR/AcrR family transcriptional regulator [Actinomyces viscosus]TFH53185.1 TetR/AcrR family transcriptional regulator [Actinomyces viscosus]VEI15552.1 HTH-type transcriptional repressor AcnR [Actinomyces viscosus]
MTTRSSAHGQGSDSDSGDSGASASDDIREATRALNEAISAFSRVVEAAGQGALRTSENAVSASLERASQKLATASTAVSGAASGRRGGRRRSEETRARILAAAREVFAAKGYEGASVSDIASAAGFTKGAFYSSFSSKEALFLEVVTCDDDSASQVGQEVSPDQWGEQLQELPIEDVVLHLETWLYAIRHEDSRDRLTGAWRRWLKEISVQMARSRGRGEPSRQDEETAFGLLAVSIFGRVSAAATSSEEIEPIIQRLSERLLGNGTD